MTRQRFGVRGGTQIARSFGTVALSDRRRLLVFEYRRITEDIDKAQEWLNRLNDMRAVAYYRLRTEQGGMTADRAWAVLGAPAAHQPRTAYWKKLYDRGQDLDEYADDLALREADADDLALREADEFDGEDRRF